MGLLVCLDAVETYSIFCHWEQDNSCSIEVSLQKGNNSPTCVCSAVHDDCSDPIKNDCCVSAYLIFVDGNYFFRVFNAKVELEDKGGRFWRSATGLAEIYYIWSRCPKTASVVRFRADSNLVDESG